MKALLLIPLLALLPGPALAQSKQPPPPPVPLAQPLRPDPAPLSPARLPARFDDGLDELVREGILHPIEREMMRKFPCPAGKLWPACKDPGVVSPGAQPLSPKEQQLLDRIRASKTPVEQWRRFGHCSYDWTGQKRHANGIRTTGVDCGGTAMRWQIGVSCDRLLVNIRSREGVWSGWEPPAGPESKFRQGEDLMVASLCANAMPAPVAAPAAAEVKP